MRVASFAYQGQTGVGVATEAGLADVTPVAATMLDLIAGGADLADQVAQLAGNPQVSYQLDDVRLLAPVPVPRRNILCVGRNYASHVAEGARAGRNDGKLPDQPTWFTKAVTSMCGPYDPIRLDTDLSRMYDWEAELALVIGRTGRRIPRESALDYVHSYCVLNDITARDIQHGYGDQWFKGKSVDDTSPVGPWLTTADAVPHPDKLDITCTVNGAVKQHSNTSMLLFDIPTLIADISQAITLHPGDIISTGTPEGVGNSRTPREYLAPGDVIETEVEGLGYLRNECVVR
jgi:2-keto-4-pentenoate hydratase/2-oxohepta-3-ene-1,7-dioic acid hydratase in catechol pathway